MNREVLFRGARVCDEKLVNGALVMVKENDESEKYVPNIVISYGPDTFDWFEVEQETVGQFTGITDKNELKIFEGDILETEEGIIWVVSWSEQGEWIACDVFYEETDIDRVSGAFLNTMKSWVAPLQMKDLFRRLDNSTGKYPISYLWFKVDSHVLDSIFVNQVDSTWDTDQFLVNAYFDVKKVQNLNYDGMPY